MNTAVAFKLARTILSNVVLILIIYGVRVLMSRLRQAATCRYARCSIVRLARHDWHSV